MKKMLKIKLNNKILLLKRFKIDKSKGKIKKISKKEIEKIWENIIKKISMMMMCLWKKWKI